MKALTVLSRNEGQARPSCCSDPRLANIEESRRAGYNCANWTRHYLACAGTGGTVGFGVDYADGLAPSSLEKTEIRARMATPPAGCHSAATGSARLKD